MHVYMHLLRYLHTPVIYVYVNFMAVFLLKTSPFVTNTPPPPPAAPAQPSLEIASVLLAREILLGVLFVCVSHSLSLEDT